MLPGCTLLSSLMETFLSLHLYCYHHTPKDSPKNTVLAELVAHEQLVPQKTLWVTYSHESLGSLATRPLLSSLQSLTACGLGLPVASLWHALRFYYLTEARTLLDWVLLFNRQNS